MLEGRICILVYLILLTGTQSFGNDITKNLRKYEVITPYLMESDSEETFNNPNLSTLDEDSNDHKDNVEFWIKAAGKTYHLDLKQNKYVHSDHVKISNDNSDVNKHDFPNCHYQGKLKNGNGDAIISTCGDGLSGTIHDNDAGTTHYIDKLDDGTQIMYKESDMIDLPFKSFAEPIERTGHEYARERYYASKYMDNAKTQNDFSVELNDTKYVEFGVIADNAFVKRCKNPADAIIKVGEIINYVDFLWSKFNVRIVMNHLEVFADKDKFESPTFGGLNKYKWNVLIPLKKWKIDAIHLITGASLGGGGVVGLAYVNELCADIAEGMSRYWRGITGSIIAHELGHNFGLPHDYTGCKCNGRCVMSAGVTYHGSNAWSNCSRKAVERRCAIGYCLCLYKNPKKTWDGPICGNGVVEENEDCDCGKAKVCNNPCCEPSTCKLKGNAKCAHGQCCENCQFKAKGTVCRKALNKCDITESCTGESNTCPKNIFMENYMSCENGKSFCHNGLCVPSLNDLCQAIWGSESFHGDQQTCKLGKYRHFNMRGDKFGNCGRRRDGSFIPCHFNDVDCGKLQCTGKRFISRTYSRVRSYNTKNGVCYSSQIPFGNDVADVTIPNDGTKCGVNKVCRMQQCLLISTLHEIISKCHNLCGSKGHCTSEGYCLCKPGYSCPDCSKSDPASPGGLCSTFPPRPNINVGSACHCKNGGVCDKSGNCYCPSGYSCPGCGTKDSTNISGKQCHKRYLPVVPDSLGILTKTCPYRCGKGGKCNLATRSCLCPAGTSCPDCYVQDSSIKVPTQCPANRVFTKLQCDLEKDSRRFIGKLEKYGCRSFQNYKNTFVLLKSYRGSIIWNPYNLLSLTCGCAKIAAEQGYNFIKMQYWGECWATNNYGYVVNLPKRSGCVNKKYDGCRKQDICIGDQFEGSVYRVFKGL